MPDTEKKIRGQHIVGAMGTKSTGPAWVLPPRNDRVSTLPASTFSPLPHRPPPRRWDPKCNHISMVRLYNVAYRCENCQRQGPLGWLYRCAQDREAVILEARESGLKVRRSNPTCYHGLVEVGNGS